MAIGSRYASCQPAQASFDAIVIGSGVGGMGVAAILAKAGKRVMLLEQHATLGGFSHVFRRQGYEWDVGLHYVGGVHRPGSVPQRVFSHVSDGRLQWTALGEVYDKAVFGDDVYEFVSGRETFKASLKSRFPDVEDGRAIDAYFRLLDAVDALPPTYFMAKALPPWLAAIIGRPLQRRALAYAGRTTLKVLRELTDNARLIGVLTAQYGDYGLPPAQSSFYMHAMLANHYMDGAAYPVGGAASLAATIVPVIEAHGGVVLSSAPVAGILVDGNRACGVRMADGATFQASAVISDAGVFNTFGKLLPDAVAQRHRLPELLRQVAPATAHVALYLGLRQSAADLSLPRHNYWLFPPDYDHDRSNAGYTHIDAPLPVAFVSFPSAKDPSWDSRHPDRAVIEVITLAPYAWFSPWAQQPRGARGADYAALKERLAAQLLEQLYRVQPQLRGKIDYQELSTPLSTQHFVGHEHGAIYGLAHTPERFRQRWLRAHTPVRNLYLTGQDICVASITGALMGGVLAASALLGKNMLAHILKANSGQ
jgi:all-trans-retinol 13,14-reductase